MAVAAGVSVANLYYSQPILTQIARSFSVPEVQVGGLPAWTQVGYGLGLMVLAPLGDRLDRKALILGLQGLLIASLCAMVFVNNLATLSILSLFVGLFSVSTQIILPMAAGLAGRSQGKSVAVVFTGVLVGILLARVYSGWVAGWLSWRWVYGLSAGMMLIVLILVWIRLPQDRPNYSGHYGALLVSTFQQLVRFPALRRTALLGALVFGAFSSFWTTLTFHLSRPPFGFGSDVIGLFGLLAVGGALGAPWFGKWAVRVAPARLQLVTVSFVLISVELIQWWPGSLAAFLVATVLLDLGVQATQLLSLAQIYALDDSAYSRINTVQMTSLFAGGAIGTLAGVFCWSWGGWTAVGWQLALWTVLALGVAALVPRAPRRSEDLADH